MGLRSAAFTRSSIALISRTACVSGSRRAPISSLRVGMSTAAFATMACQVITCPESHEPETIDFELTRFGMVITDCTRLATDSTHVCPRTCARINRGCPAPHVIELQSLLHHRS